MCVSWQTQLLMAGSNRKNPLPLQEREGRWWWEDTAAKECGLHSGNVKKADGALRLPVPHSLGSHVGHGGLSISTTYNWQRYHQHWDGSESESKSSPLDSWALR